MEYLRHPAPGFVRVDRRESVLTFFSPLRNECAKDLRKREGVRLMIVHRPRISGLPPALAHGHDPPGV
jgi:hypothetical protein